MEDAVDFAVSSILGRAAGLFVNVQGGVDDEHLERAVGEGKVVLVTGASRGIGAATARPARRGRGDRAARGAPAEPLEEVAADIASLGGTAEVLPVGPLRIQERLAGSRRPPSSATVTLTCWSATRASRSTAPSRPRWTASTTTSARSDLNYLGPVQLVLALLPSMLERRSGHLVNMSTAGVFAPAPVGWSAYIGSKTAFDVYLRSAEIELADDGIEITSIYMTLVETEMSAPSSSDTFRYVPALSAEEAADRVCAGIARSDSRVAPWWTTPAAVWGSVSHLSGNLATRTFVRVHRQIARRSREDDQA